MSATDVLLRLIPAAIAVILLFAGFRSLRRKRLLENLPTSKVAGVFLGLTEVKGTAEPPPRGGPLRSYLAGASCVWYGFRIEEHWRKTETESYTDDKGNRKTRTKTTDGWRTVASGDVRRPFFLRDDTGDLRIVPDCARMEGVSVLSRTCGPGDPLYYGKGPRGSISHSTHRRRFSENVVAVGARLYVVGTARLREDVVAPEIAYDKQDEMFLISTRDEAKVVRGHLWTAVACLFFGAAGAGGSAWLLAQSAGATVGVVALYGLVAFAYYLGLVYNGLVGVRNRVRNAFSQIDIQLKRRYDLIPNLVACVKGYTTHESETFGKIAELRYTAPAKRAADAAAAVDAQTRALGQLFAVVEKYPTLKADGQFLALQRELAATERKIALAREFLNESVTALNNRIDTFPDLLLARVGGFARAEYLKIEAFEKQPVEVKFEEAEEPLPPPPAAPEPVAALEGPDSSPDAA